MRIIKIAVFYLLIPVFIGVAAGGFFAFSRSVPSIAELKQDISTQGARIYADDDILIGELSVTKGQYVPLSKMPKDLINAVISIEDNNFWKHKGIDYLAIVRAAMKDVLKRHLKEGGSTITQQLAKITFLTPEKTFKRKFRELMLARRIEKNLTKEEILELYLNRVYLGHGAYGVEMASKIYFGKSVKNLTIPEAALIAGLLKAPSTYSPFTEFKRAKDRQMTVLSRMEEEGYISRKQLEDAEKSPIYLSNMAESMEAYGYFIDYIKKYLEKKYGAEMVYRGGLRVHTTMDRKAQVAAQRALKNGLRDLDKRRGWRGPVDHKNIDSKKDQESKLAFKSMLLPDAGDIVSAVVTSVSGVEAQVKASGIAGMISAEDAAWTQRVIDKKTNETRWLKEFSLRKTLKPGDVILAKVKSARGGRLELSLEQEPEVQGSVVALDSKSGFIRALVGGYDYGTSQYNRAIFASRQAGSSFKPFIFSVALQRGFTPASIIVDEEISYRSGPGKVWTPKNYDNEYHGPTRLRDALAHSINVVTVKLVDEVGIDRVIDFAANIGITENIKRDLTIALGSVSISPLELSSAYGAFANGGIKTDPIGIKYITDSKGRVIESNEPKGKEVMDPQTAFLMTSMMQSVVAYGTGGRAKELGRPVAGKTGTTNDYRDAWFMGYTTDTVCGVWVGFDDRKPLGHQETGARAALPIWVEFMKAVSSENAEEFPMPPDIETRFIDPQTGLLSNKWADNAVLEYFRKGTEPTERSSPIWPMREPTNPFF